MRDIFFHAERRGKQYRVRELIFLAGMLSLATLLIYLTDGDRFLARIIYGTDGIWPGIDRFPWNILYDWAPAPGILLAVSALIIFVGGFFSLPLKKHRRSAVFLLLLLAIGPGLIVNVLLKDNLGRARPREIMECGGTHPYTEIWQKGTTGSNSSFPSGHASIAFYTLAPWFIFRDGKKKTATGFLLFGLGFGIAVGLARMLQGGHFLSDVLWAGGIVYLVGGILALLLLPCNGARPLMLTVPASPR